MQIKKKYLFNVIQVLLITALVSSFTAAFGVPETQADSGAAKTVVVIDPGHGGDDLGCRSTENKLCEKDITMAAATELAKVLEQAGIKVKLTRNGVGDHPILVDPLRFLNQKKSDLDERIEVASRSEADFFISLHVNSYYKKDRAGAVVYYQEGSKPGSLLAGSIQKELRYIPEMPKRTSQGGNYYLLSHQKIPAVIIELGYISNQKDAQRMANPEYIGKIARAICAGISSYNPASAADTPVSASTTKISLKGACKDFTVSGLQQTVHRAGDGKNERMAKFMLDSLFTNSDQAKTAGVILSKLVNLHSLKLTGSQATVDLGLKAGDNCLGSDEEWFCVFSIASLLLDFPYIEKIKFTVDGQPRETLAGHIDISEPISRDLLAFTRAAEGSAKGKRAKVAIVIDDFGSEESKDAECIFKIGHPLTFAVMPNLPYTVEHAKRAAELGYSVIVHLPMQPENGPSNWVGPHAINIKMSAEEIKEQAQKDFEQVPYAQGFNNHMGSLATSDINTLRPLLEVARENEFFVLDSRTSDKSKLAYTARDMGISTAERNVFLDNKRNVNQMKKQLEILSEEALAKGSAVGIGHVGEFMSKAITEMIPVMEAKGIEFVYLSEIVQ